MNHCSNIHHYWYRHIPRFNHSPWNWGISSEHLHLTEDFDRRPVAAYAARESLGYCFLGSLILVAFSFSATFLRNFLLGENPEPTLARGVFNPVAFIVAGVRERLYEAGSGPSGFILLFITVLLAVIMFFLLAALMYLSVVQSTLLVRVSSVLGWGLDGFMARLAGLGGVVFAFSTLAFILYILGLALPLPGLYTLYQRYPEYEIYFTAIATIYLATVALTLLWSLLHAPPTTARTAAAALLALVSLILTWLSLAHPEVTIGPTPPRDDGWPGNTLRRDGEED
ncbi:hypothetical protein [Aeropyrum camini]|uniref:hypothetical protein n=1 Tax=Aeropyrum camini TaxID=229980 RepID=UPI0012E2AF8F|nr:hypothetical protein [Aeropyrum camini]